MAQRLYAYERVDRHRYQRQLRVLQSLWREERGYEIGVHSGPKGTRPLGSRLPMPWAKETLANYLNEEIRDVVRREVLAPSRDRTKLYGKPRIFDDLLSSQPLAFNLFAIPSRHRGLATSFVHQLTGDSSLTIDRIDFEWSPGRGDERFTGDRSAFDVFILCSDDAGDRSFIGVEVKYHENLDTRPAPLRVRYEELSRRCGWFDLKQLRRLERGPLQQLWRDHLLAASLIESGDFARGLFVVLYPSINVACHGVVNDYEHCLRDSGTFSAWTLEEAVEALRESGARDLADALFDRYLDLSKLES